jgi:predicted RND superfamily exporter protein
VGEFEYKIDLLYEIRKIVKEEEAKSGKRFSIAGTAVLDDAMFRYNETDQALLLPLMLLIIVGAMFFMFRRVGMTLLPLLVVILSVVWAYGFLVLLGYEINLISVILGPLLLAVAIADSMHIVTGYLQKTAAGRWDKIECIERSFSEVAAPCLMASLTTSLGMLSLMSADLAPIREFGLVAAGGVMFAFIITVLLLPILLSALPVPKWGRADQFRAGSFATLLGWLGRWRRGRATAILLVCAAAIIPAGLLLARLTVGTNSLDYFRKNDPVRVETEWIDSAIGGTTSLEFFIDGGREGALKEPDLLRRMERFQEYLEGLDGVTGVYSAVDLVKTLNRSFHDGDERMFAIPDSAVEVAQQLLIIEGSEDLEGFLSYDYSKGRISARIEINASHEISLKMPEIEERMLEIFGDAATVTATGWIYLMYNMEGYLLSSQIKSFLLAFIVIAVAIIVMLRSLRLGLLAMIPNMLPILLTMGLMPLFDIHLDVGTVMIAGIALGLVVDDSIHFLSRLKVEEGRTPDVRDAIEAAIIETGRPIIFTSIVLSLGFLIFVFASFNPIIHFGILSALVIMLALVFDLVVLPAIMGFFGGRQ